MRAQEFTPGWYAGVCHCGAVILGTAAAVNEELEQHRPEQPALELDPRRIIAAIRQRAQGNPWRGAAMPRRPLPLEAET